MAWQYPISTSGAGIIANLGDGADDLYVGAQVMVASTDSNTVRGIGSNHEARIYGTVAAGLNGIYLGDAASVDANNRITINAGARVDAINAGTAFQSFNSDLINRGAITGDSIGAYFEGTSASSDSSLTNSGTIEAGYAVYKLGSETLVTNNSGLIQGVIYSYISFANSIDQITNTGRMIGDITLGAGNDIYNGAAGRFSGGEIYGNAGEDTIAGGIDNDLIYGGTENDTLNGNAGQDTLIGEAGDDVINGGAGNDFMNGGLGLDTLNGGVGNDHFLFNVALSAANRDVILNFANAAGNNDTIRLDNAVMPGLGAAGALNAALFKVGPAATDANDRVVYNQATGQLFYDANGNAAGGATLLAVITNKPVLTAADFLVV